MVSDLDFSPRCARPRPHRGGALHVSSRSLRVDYCMISPCPMILRMHLFRSRVGREVRARLSGLSRDSRCVVESAGAHVQKYILTARDGLLSVPKGKGACQLCTNFYALYGKKASRKPIAHCHARPWLPVQVASLLCAARHRLTGVKKSYKRADSTTVLS